MGERFTIEIEDTGPPAMTALRLRGLLKVALRRFGFRAVEILPALEARERMSAGGKGNQIVDDLPQAPEQAARICSTNRQYGRELPINKNGGNA